MSENGDQSIGAKDGNSREEKNVSRRSFLKYTSATVLGIPFLFSCATQGGGTPDDPLSKPNYAFIGTGGRAKAHVAKMANIGANCPCFCDVDTRQQKPAATHWPKAETYQDYRRMYDEMGDQIDAVFITTPDHHHFPAAIMALQRDIHVYCEKPLTWSPWEARQLEEVAGEKQLVTQMGNQRHSRWKRVVNLVRAGVIGEVQEVHSWTNRPVWPQGINRPDKTDPVPEALDWDVWLGPAEKRPFNQKAYHRFNWRGWFDFGAGALGDMACHIMDGMFWAQEAGRPESVELTRVDQVTKESFPAMSRVKWDFPEKEGRPAFTALWYDGNPSNYDNKPKRPEGISKKEWQKAKNGNLFVGTKGKVFTAGYGDLKKVIPEERAQEAKNVEKAYVSEPDPGHHMEFVQAVRGDKPWDFPKCNFSYSAPMTETVLLGVLAQRRAEVGKTLQYNHSKGKFTNDAKVNGWIRRDYRDGWKVW